MSGNSDEIIRLIARGWKAKEISDFLGVSESYVSQIANSEEAKEQVGKANIKEFEIAEAFDSLLDKAEKKALEQVEKSLPLMRGTDAARIFKVLNEAKRKKDSLGRREATVGGGVIVNVVLPQAAKGALVVTRENQIVEVDGKTLVSATPTQLDRIFEERKGKTVTEAAFQLESKQSPVLENLNEKKREQAMEVLENVSTVKSSRASRIPKIDVTDII